MAVAYVMARVTVAESRLLGGFSRNPARNADTTLLEIRSVIG